MTVKVPEAQAFALFCYSHEEGWPEDVKQAAYRVQLSLNVANGTGFRQSKAMQDLFASDWAAFQAKLRDATEKR